MKKIGLIGGMSYESTLVYYRLINEKINTIFGGLHSSKCIIESLNFAEVQELQNLKDYKSLNKLMIKSAINLENSEAEIIILCCNTMHICAENIKQNINIPFLHIAEETGKEIKRNNIKNVLLLGTKATMEKDFYKSVLKKTFNIEVIIPSKNDREIIHNVIYEELVYGIITSESKNKYLKIIKENIDKGAEGVILGCTEIPLLIKDNDCDIPIFDTTKIHIESTVEFLIN
jgi:aspartate racemase